MVNYQHHRQDGQQEVGHIIFKMEVKLGPQYENVIIEGIYVSSPTCLLLVSFSSAGADPTSTARRRRSSCSAGVALSHLWKAVTGTLRCGKIDILG